MRKRIGLMALVVFWALPVFGQRNVCGPSGCNRIGTQLAPVAQPTARIRTRGGGYLTVQQSAAPTVPFSGALPSAASQQQQQQVQTIPTPATPQPQRDNCGNYTGQWTSLDDLEPFDTITYGSGRVGFVYRTKVCTYPGGRDQCPVHSAPVNLSPSSPALSPSTVLPGPGPADEKPPPSRAEFVELTWRVEKLERDCSNPPLPDGTEAITIPAPDGPSTSDLEAKLDGLAAKVEELKGGGALTVQVQQLTSVQQTIQTQISGLVQQMNAMEEQGQSASAIKEQLADLTDLEAKVERLEAQVAQNTAAIQSSKIDYDSLAAEVVARLQPIKIEQYDDAGDRLPDLEVRLGEYLPPFRVIKDPMKRGANGKWEQAGEPAVDRVHLGEGFKMRLYPLD